MSKEDPKHGRWILPLVVLALVAFTYTFVNNLPPAETPTTTTAPAAAQTTTTEPPEVTTTTVLTPEVIAFVATVDSLSAEADAMRANAQTVNDDYPGTAGYDATRTALSALREQASDFSDTVAGFTDTVPAAAAEKWSDVTTAAAAMKLEADKMFDGLVNTSGSETRLAALDNFSVAAATFTQTLDDAKEAALEPPADSE